MALVQDASSPATSINVQSVQANTCLSFGPPDDPLFLALWAGDSTGGTGPATPTMASFPAQSWTVDARDYRDTGSPVVDGQAAVGHAVATGPVSASTVTVTNMAASGSRDSALRVIVMTGHDPATPIGVTATGRQSSGTSLSASATATATGSWSFWVVADWNQGDPTGWTEGAGQTMIEKGVTFGISYAIVQRSSADGVATATISFSLSGLPSGGQYHWVLVEVVPDPAAVDVTTVATDLMLDPGQALF